MTLQAVTATITGRTASGTGFDLILDPGHTKAIGFMQVDCSSIGPNVPRLVVSLEALLHGDVLSQLLEILRVDCPGLEERVEEIQAIVNEVRESKAFIDIRFNPSVEGHCGDELCYWDDHLGKVICFE